MKTTSAAALALILGLTQILARPVNDPSIDVRDANINSSHVAIESRPLEPDRQALNPFLGEDMNSIRNDNPDPKTKI
ncbi:hypothetical protein CLIM01_11907 [Colletotrichum limetticola]|uniref:Uncharacterized protein n=1 Tax=Colletotrichum limetticola TaxID=1209924 RepID=A0ABQ9PFB5_9PEZI|nr:hypothetical protein CLIM01_11907 [Colletotrichum limetticola]